MNYPRKDMWLHSLMCVVGGFLGAYSLLCRDFNFGNSQTSNIIQLFTSLLGNNFFEFFLRVAGVLLYVSAILIYVYLDKKTSVNLQRYSVIVTFLGVIVLSLLPQKMHPVAGILPVFFMMSTQWSVFHGVGKYNSSTIFSTNNIRQFTLGMGTYIIAKEKEGLEKAKFFGNSLLWYHIGVIASFFACKYFGVTSSLFLIPLVVTAFALTFNREHSVIISKKLRTA